MKTVAKFLSNNPSYVKCGNQVISNRTGISVNTVSKFKKTGVFKILNNQYRNGIVAM